MPDSKVCIAEIVTAHGVRGLVKLRCYLEDPSVLSSYNPLESEDGRRFSLTLKNPVKGDWLAAVDGIVDRTAAEALRHLRLYTDRGRLPDPGEGEVYIQDLIGCRAVTAGGEEVGVVIALQNFGASDLVEIRPLAGKTFYLPLIPPYVGEIDLQAGTVVVEPAEEFRG